MIFSLYVYIQANDVVTVSLGEVFALVISAEGENKNLKDAVYSYTRNPTSNPLNIIVVDLKPEDVVLGFAPVSKSQHKM